MSFKKKKYTVLKNAISQDLALFVYNYFLMKRRVARTMRDTKFISQFSEEWGTWEDEQVPNTYSHYSDVAMETLLLKVQPAMEKHTGLKLTPTYSYARIYKTGDVLHRHKDRPSCEISTTLNLGGDPWPIFLNPNPKAGFVSGPIGGKYGTQKYNPTNDKGVRINLKPGDMLIYSGCDLEHWRDEFQGVDCGQVFLHYNQVSKKVDENMFDKRQHLGLPAWYKGRMN